MAELSATCELQAAELATLRAAVASLEQELRQQKECTQQAHARAAADSLRKWRQDATSSAFYKDAGASEPTRAPTSPLSVRDLAADA